jgi:uncharacterized NAD(P)/FAD-binding protein YdhS
MQNDYSPAIIVFKAHSWSIRAEQIGVSNQRHAAYQGLPGKSKQSQEEQLLVCATIQTTPLRAREASAGLFTTPKRLIGPQSPP